MNSKIFAAVVISALILIPSYGILGEISDRNEVRVAGGGGGGTVGGMVAGRLHPT